MLSPANLGAGNAPQPRDRGAPEQAGEDAGGGAAFAAAPHDAPRGGRGLRKHRGHEHAQRAASRAAGTAAGRRRGPRGAGTEETVVGAGVEAGLLDGVAGRHGAGSGEARADEQDAEGGD